MKGQLSFNDAGQLELNGILLKVGDLIEVLHRDAWVQVRIADRSPQGAVGVLPSGETIELTTGMNAQFPSSIGQEEVGPGVSA